MRHPQAIPTMVRIGSTPGAASNPHWQHERPRCTHITGHAKSLCLPILHQLSVPLRSLLSAPVMTTTDAPMGYQFSR